MFGCCVFHFRSFNFAISKGQEFSEMLRKKKKEKSYLHYNFTLLNFVPENEVDLFESLQTSSRKVYQVKTL